MEKLIRIEIVNALFDYANSQGLLSSKQDIKDFDKYVEEKYPVK